MSQERSEKKVGYLGKLPVKGLMKVSKKIPVHKAQQQIASYLDA